MTTPSPQLHTDYIDGVRAFWSCEPMAFDNGESLILLPANFISDGLSIPKWCQPLINTSKAPQWIYAGMLHDFLYRIRPCKMTRKQCDKLFRVWMQAYNVGAVKRSIIYRAVRIGGRKSWRKQFPQYAPKHHP